MSTPHRLARLGLSHLENDPKALAAELDRRIAASPLNQPANPSVQPVTQQAPAQPNPPPSPVPIAAQAQQMQQPPVA